MYSEYFGLNREPFSISPDPAFLYPSEQHTDALAHLNYGLEKAGGFILLTGEVGTGKTTVSRVFLQQLPDDVSVAYILNAKLNAQEVLVSICDELSITLSAEKSVKNLVGALHAYLLNAHANGKRTLVVIEEAQNLTADVLEVLRLLTNLETDTAKLLHILLVGQPELLDLIHRRELRQLNQRVVARSHLGPFNRKEMGAYINHRLRTAGARRGLFSRSALNALYRVSEGFPRVINLIADRALLGAYSKSAGHANRKLVLQAAQEINGEQPARRTNYWGVLSSAVLIAVIVFGAVWYVLNHGLPAQNIMSTEQGPDAQLKAIGVSSSPVSEAPVATSLPQAVLPVAVQSTSDNSLIGSSGKPPVESTIGDTRVDERPQAVAFSPQIGAPVHTAENPAKHQQTSAQTAPVVAITPYSQLAKLWGLSGQFNSSAQLCSNARASGMACTRSRGMQWEDLLRSNRPALVTISINANIQTAALMSISGESVMLVTEEGLQQLLKSQFMALWQADSMVLWQPPKNFTEAVIIGDINPSVVAWLQTKLTLLYPEFGEQLITGGRYTEPLADRLRIMQREQGLRADGIVGRMTVMRLNELSGDVPTLTGGG